MSIYSETNLVQPDDIIVKEFAAGEGKLGAKLICSPLERGYAHTIGNALRRVLMSSIRGAAVIAAKIEDAEHAYASIRDIREDVIDIIMNIKGINLDYTGTGIHELTLEASEEGPVTAGQIQLDHSTKITNPEHVLFHLNRKRDITIHLIISSGQGYVAAEDHKMDFPLGYIPIDALYSPIRHVNYHVEEAHVGGQLDYDKLVMEIVTNSVVTPKNAFEMAAQILQLQLSNLISAEIPVVQKVEPKEEETNKIEELLCKRVEELDLPVRIANCLANEKVYYIGELIQKEESDMTKTPNFGRKSLDKLKELLAGMGLRLGMKVDWPPEGFVPSTKDDEHML